MTFYVWINTLMDLTFFGKRTWPLPTKQIEYAAWASSYYLVKKKGKDWFKFYAWSSKVLGYLPYL